MSDSQTQVVTATPDWIGVDEFIKSPIGAQFFASYSSFHWLLREHRRRMIEAGAMIKRGKSLALSISRAPAVIEGIYREKSLAALDR